MVIRAAIIALLLLRCSALGQGFGFTFNDVPWMGRFDENGVTNPPNAVTFPAASDYLTRDGQLTGAVTNKTGTISFWIKGSTAASVYFDSLGLAYAYFDSYVSLYAYRVGPVSIMEINSSGVGINCKDGNWHHVMASWDLSDTGKRHLYIDGQEALTAVTYTDDMINWTSTDWTVGSGNKGMRLYELWITHSYFDLSVAGNRYKFRDVSGNPVELGSHGELPTGTSPIIYFRLPVPDWEQNQGTGGGFTEHGVITDGGGTPP